MIRLILVRHGNTFEKGETPTQVGARTDLPLTSQGRSQAQSFARCLASERIEPTAIFAGTLKRQIETAQIVGAHFQAENKIKLNEPALTEIDYGPWEGLTSEQIMQQWPEEYTAWTAEARWPSFFGRTQEEHRQMIKEWVKGLHKQHGEGETVVGVTSNGVIRFFYSLQELLWQNLVKERRIEELKVKTGHFCELLIHKDSLEVVSWNRAHQESVYDFKS